MNNRAAPLLAGVSMRFGAILFDIGDTLWHSGAAPSPAEFRRIRTERAATALAGFGVTSADPASAARTAWASLTGAMATVARNGLAEPDYGAVAANALASDGINLSPGQARAFLDAIYISGPESGKAAYPDARTVLERLRERGFRLGMVTNRAFGGERFRDDLRTSGLDLPWEVAAISVEVGYVKPHPAIFAHALNALGLPPAKVLMVGDSLAEDVAGAQSMGMAAAWRRSRPDAEGVCPDFAFDELSELLLLPELQAPA
jgi:HAD superfamily hydrolase (TIGR01549 family)